MKFDEKTRWAINILIAYAVCTSDELYCKEDCPLYKDDVVWTDENIVTAVKWLKSNIPSTKSDCCSGGENCTLLTQDEVLQIIDERITIYAMPVIHATWNEREDDYADRNPVYYIYECSNCGFDAKREGIKWKYCPNCGAKMVKGEL